MGSNYTCLKANAVEKHLENLTQLTFEVTDACNLKCKYCGYGEYYYDYDKREDKLLTLDQAIPVLEYMAEKWRSTYYSSYKKNTPSKQSSWILTVIYLMYYIALKDFPLKITNC